ncbi:ABC transporter substrate-binding protein [Desulfovibrio sp. JC022]|uniref:ABC transporter substrate-binding protein n=1 Tax=Desulfovibrio sp. JC022 TaxID=2593642 RepID=UPI0013D0922B|nr:ABC transporter substrate-binding protein [Desulfovibrio sp. JC022]NDV22034.1 ABC transporter substrate-binding protein [Desulfovibrio sp. JC022]
MKILTSLLVIFCLMSSPLHADEIVLGTIFGLKGSQAPTAQEALNGALLAVQKINNSKSGTKIRLEVESSAGETTGILNSANKLAQSKGIIAATGIIDDNTALTAGPAFQAVQLPFLCTGAQADALSYAGTNIFTLAVPDIRTGQLLAEFACNIMQISNILLVRSDLADSTARQADSFARRFKQNKGNIMAEMRITEPDPDLSFISEKLKDLAPPPPANSTVINETVGASDFVDSAVGLTIQKRDTNPAKPQVEAVVVFAPARIGAKLLEQLKNDRQVYPILGGTSFDNVPMQQTMKAYPSRIYFASQAAMDREAPLVRSFVNSYKSLFGSTPETGYAALGFDSVMLLAATAKRHGSTSTAIRNGLPLIKDFEGVCGKISFQENGAEKPLYIMQVESGQKSMATSLD